MAKAIITPESGVKSAARGFTAFLSVAKRFAFLLIFQADKNGARAARLPAGFSSAVFIPADFRVRENYFPEPPQLARTTIIASRTQ